MGKILVTGASGRLGSATVDMLLKTVSADQIEVMARDVTKDKIAGFKKQGVDVRTGDYFDYDSLVKAFAGVDKLFMVSAPSFTDREKQHANVVKAAKEARVKHIVYTAMQRIENSSNIIPGVTESDIQAEKAIKASGLTYTILRDALYFDGVIGHLVGPNFLKDGISVWSPNNQKFTLVTVPDLAEGAAAVLSGKGHENKTYTLGSSESASFKDITEMLSKITHSTVPFQPLASTEEFVAAKVKAGAPAERAGWAVGWLVAIDRGEFSEVTKDLEKLLGRKPTSHKEFYEEYCKKLPVSASQK
jgi:NAD(P)H dehydrogenase (quinone)